MESFKIFGLVAAFLQFLPLQLCVDIQGIQIISKDKDGLVNSRINLTFLTNSSLEGDVDIIPIVEDRPEDVPEDVPQNRMERTCIENFCENVEDYPLDMINNAAKDISSSLFEGLQGNEIEIENRQSNEGSTGLCDKRVRTVYPQWGKTKSNKEVFIVNHPGKEQGVVVTVCRDNLTGCGKAIFSDIHTGDCTQKYSEVNLLTFDTDSPDELKFDTFYLPSCCVCSLKVIY